MTSRLPLKPLAMAFAFALTFLSASRLMLVRVVEESMTPTLADGQWILVLRGKNGVHPGDLAVFVSPAGKELAVKRCVSDGETPPVVGHGWMVTRWGRWYLTGPQWDSLASSPQPNGDALFMVGDNQFRSLDSRSYGYVPRESLVGKVVLPSGGKSNG